MKFFFSCKHHKEHRTTTQSEISLLHARCYNFYNLIRTMNVCFYQLIAREKRIDFTTCINTDQMPNVYSCSVTLVWTCGCSHRYHKKLIDRLTLFQLQYNSHDLHCNMRILLVSLVLTVFWFTNKKKTNSYKGCPWSGNIVLDFWLRSTYYISFVYYSNWDNSTFSIH